MHLFYVLLKSFPYYAVPSVVILIELARHFRRRASRAQYLCLAIAGGLVLLVISWFIFRGDLNAEHWAKALG